MFAEKYMRKECSVCVSAGLLYQRSQSISLTGAHIEYFCNKVALATEATYIYHFAVIDI